MYCRSVVVFHYCSCLVVVVVVVVIVEEGFSDSLPRSARHNCSLCDPRCLHITIHAPADLIVAFGLRHHHKLVPHTYLRLPASATCKCEHQQRSY